MAREIAEIPRRPARLLARSRSLFENIAERIERAKPRIMVFCGRGSSGHVGVYLRYLFEVRLGLLASAAAPSVVTAYRRPPDFRDALFVVVSQSGRSPDLIDATQDGAQIRRADASDRQRRKLARGRCVRAGAADRRGNRAFRRSDQDRGAVDDRRRAARRGACARRRPERGFAEFAATIVEVRSPATGRPGPSVPPVAAAAFVVGRGYGLGCVREIALKVSEILRVPALGYSAAELRHGPRASVTPATPVLVLRQNDPAAIAIDELVRDLSEARETVFAAGGAAGTLPWIGDGHPACDPVAMLIPAYRAIEAVARRRGSTPTTRRI